jgi:adenine deaminase
VEALRIATLNPAEHFRLTDRGGIAPGRRADIVILDDLDELTISQVFIGGVLAAEDGKALPWSLPPSPLPPPVSMEVDWSKVDLTIPGRDGEARVIQVIPDQIVTGHLIENPSLAEGEVISDPVRDLLKIAVLDRHTSSGRVGLGLVTGMGLKRGAIAGTVAHDHHNLVVIGADDESMLTAARAVASTGGGLAAALGEKVLGALPLPVGGLMSQEPIEEVRLAFEGLLEASRELGTPLHDPFMAMSFLALEVIPALKITDQGLVDVDRFEKVDFWV